MLVIYKKELRSYFHSMMAYLYLAFFVAFAGVYYTAYCLNYGITNYAGYVLPGITILFLAAVPILTMKLVAEERKQKTDQLLLTSPVKLHNIILGKYFAVMTLFAISLLITVVFAVSIRFFGTVNYRTLLTGYLGFFLVGACLIALGLFVSSLTENSVIAAVVSFALVLACFLMESITGNLPGRARYTIIFLVFLVGLMVFFFDAKGKNLWLTIGSGVVGVAVIAVTYLVKPELFEDGIANFFSWFSVMDRFTDFTDGILNLSSIVYYLTFVVVLLFLSTKALRRDDHKQGSKTAVSIAVVLILAVVVNVGVTKADLTYDVTSNQMYTISDESKSILKGLDKEVEIYMLSSKTDANSLYRTILEQYPKNSKNVTLSYKSLDSHPTFANKYLSDGEEASADSIVIICGDKSRYVDSQNFLNYSYNSSYQMQADSINVEPAVTEALNYVISDSTPVVYQLTGHGETALGTGITDECKSDNYEVRDLDLMTEEKVPEDAAVLVINGPTVDITDTDITKIKAYAKGEGKLYVNLNAMSEDLPNFYGFLDTYGIQVQKGVMIEADSSYYMQGNPTYLLPEYGTSSIVSTLSSGNMHVIMPVAQGFTVDEKSKYTLTSLLKSSGKSYAKVDTNAETIEKESSDVNGPFEIAALVEKDDMKKMLVTGCSNATIDQINQYSSGANSNFFMNGINYLTEQESKVAVRAKTIEEDYATYNEFSQKILSTSAIFFVPAVLLIAGIGMFLKRRRL